MTIWLINPYGPIPGEGWRDYRYTMIGEVMAGRGNTVVWWTANFSHHFKRFRSSGWKDIAVSERFTIRLVPTRGYRRNVSVGRVLFELVYLARLWRATRCDVPDLIVCVNPPQTVCAFAVGLAKRKRARVLVDLFDLWPELFVLAVPRALRRFVGPLFGPWYLLRRYSIRNADGISAVSADYLQVALAAAGPKPPPCEVAYIGVDVGAVRGNRMTTEEAEQFARAAGKKKGSLWAIYPGTLGDNYDIETLLRCSILLQERNLPVTIAVAGDGPLHERVATFVSERRPTHFCYLGKLDPVTLAKYYQICDVGLSPYVGESTVSMPTKVYDFLAAGLPVINSLSGEVARLIQQGDLGLSYRPGDPYSLCSALETLSADRNRLQTMGRNAWTAALRFDKGQQYSKLADLLERIAVKRP